MSNNFIVWLALGAGVLSIIYGSVLIVWIMRKSAGNERMQEIARAIQQGAAAYLGKQNQAMAVVALVIGVLLWWQLGIMTAFGFIVGAILSALAGYVGMTVAVRANVRTAEGARKGLPSALALLFAEEQLLVYWWWV